MKQGEFKKAGSTSMKIVDDIFHTGLGRLIDSGEAAKKNAGPLNMLFNNSGSANNNTTPKLDYSNPGIAPGGYDIDALKKDKRVQGYHVQLKRKDGSPIWVSISAEIFREKDCMEGVMVDITVAKTLTKTEKQVLNFLMKGMSNKKIAFKTKRSVRTIEDHRARIMKKLGADNIVDLTQKVSNLFLYHDGK